MLAVDAQAIAAVAMRAIRQITVERAGDIVGMNPLAEGFDGHSVSGRSAPSQAFPGSFIGVRRDIHENVLLGTVISKS